MAGLAVEVGDMNQLPDEVCVKFVDAPSVKTMALPALSFAEMSEAKFARTWLIEPPVTVVPSNVIEILSGIFRVVPLTVMVLAIVSRLDGATWPVKDAADTSDAA